MSPLPDSVEVGSLATLDPRFMHVFVVGPGEGEAIAVALANRAGWILADGCKSGAAESGLVEVLRRYRHPDEPILAYALTHPHLDHARGIVELCETYGDAIKVVALPRSRSAAVPSHVTSRRISGQKVARGIAALERLPATRLDLEVGASLPLGPGVVAQILSPPVNHTMDDPNDASAAILIQYGSAGVLLGSDLPTDTPSNSGWRGILASSPAASDVLVLKIPHHGSQTSHHDDLFRPHDGERAWVTTPFNNHHLPDLIEMTGLTWILARGRPVHLTSPPVSKHVQVPVAHPGRMSLAALRTRVEAKPIGIPLLDLAVETTPRAIQVKDSLWCFAVDDAGTLVSRWRGAAALEVTP
ncbi:MAG: hypothetical protein KIT84_02080 [Labilithrix sp.]|nr:hypothetical protein [Labilithrix sp.]MCW5809777.1 hypothetical protein [Labilithrix sp.]